MDKLEKIVMKRYIANNGDIFSKIYCPIFDGEKLPSTDAPIEEIECIAVFSTDPMPHLSYYRKDDGAFIATAGVHIHSTQAEFTEFIYENRTSSRTQLDTVSEILYFD